MCRPETYAVTIETRVFMPRSNGLLKMERRLPNIFNYLRTFPSKQFATLQRDLHFKKLSKTGHAISEIVGHDIFEMIGHASEINGHDHVKYGT
jgi:hypothetical protein